LAKDEVGLDEYEMRTQVGWYRHITLDQGRDAAGAIGPEGCASAAGAGADRPNFIVSKRVKPLTPVRL